MYVLYTPSLWGQADLQNMSIMGNLRSKRKNTKTLDLQTLSGSYTTSIGSEFGNKVLRKKSAYGVIEAVASCWGWGGREEANLKKI
jgi:hypothetical protein